MRHYNKSPLGRKMLLSLAGPGLFRFGLALLVFIDHTSRLDLGYAAVLSFFVLSGYWISRLWIARYAQARDPYVTFFVSRMWRLWPAFLVCSAIAWPLAMVNGQIPAATKWLDQIVPNLLIIGYGLDWRPIIPGWSLDIEVQFYLLAPLLIAAMTRSTTGTLIACAACSAAAVTFGAGWSVAYYIAFFAIGMRRRRSNGGRAPAWPGALSRSQVRSVSCGWPVPCETRSSKATDI